jgi:hypothetical protein
MNFKKKFFLDTAGPDTTVDPLVKVLVFVYRRVYIIRGAVVARPSPVLEVRGSSPVRDKDFRVLMRRPNYMGLATLTSFG